MTAKEYLSQYQALSNQIALLSEAKARLQGISIKITSGDLDKLRGDQIRDKVAEAVEKISSVEEQIGEQVSGLLDLRAEITGKIMSLPNPTYRELLTHRYVLGKTFEQIAVDMHYTYQWVCILHGRALQAFQTVDSN